MILFLALACQTDPLLDPVFQPATQDPAAKVALSIAGPWHVGEPLDATLAVASVQGSRLQAATGGKRGRPTEDVWTVSPSDGVSDPSPYWEDLGSFVANVRTGLRAGEDGAIELQVSQEVLVTKPGRYAVQLTTNRVDGKPLILAPVAVEVKPRDVSADKKRFDAAMKVVDSADRKEAATGFRTLMALGSPATLAAALEAIQAPDADLWWGVVLHTHPDRAGVLAGLHSVIDSPDKGTNRLVLDALAAVRYNEAFPEALPPKPPPNQVPALKAFNKEQLKRRKSLETLRIAAASRLADALATKTVQRGQALAALTNVAFNIDGIPWRDVWLTNVRKDLDQLPDNEAKSVLGDRWHLVKDPATIPALTRLAVQPTEVGDLALQRLHRLDAAAAAKAAHARFTTPVVVASDVGEAELVRLAEVSDEASAALLKAVGDAPTDPHLVRLMAHFGSADQAPAMLAAFQSLPKRTNTDVLGGYAAFFMNTDTERAVVRELLTRIEGEHPDLLVQVMRAHRRPTELLPLAMDGIASDNGLVNRAAAEVLAEHADTSFRPTLNRALFGATPSRQTAVVTALYTARNWVLRKADSARVEQLLTEERAKVLAGSMTLVTDEMSRLTARVDDGVPVLRINERDYVGREAVLAKFRQLYPGAPVKFAYGGSVGAAEPIEKLAREAGLAVFTTKAGLNEE